MNRFRTTIARLNFLLSLSLVVSLLAGAQADAQTKQAKEQKQTKRKQGKFILRVQKGDRIVFLGDSITQGGAKPNGYISLFENEFKQALPFHDVEIIGAGVSGNKVPDLQKRLDRDVLSKDPSIVVIYIGINDVWHSQRGKGTSPEDYKTGLIDLIDRCQNSEAKVLLCTPSVIGEKKAGANSLDKMLDAYSEISRMVAREKNVEILDLRLKFQERLNEINVDDKSKGLLTRDEVHLNLAGNQFVAEQMLSALRVPIRDSKPSKQVVYKTAGDVELKLHVFEPKDDGKKLDRPAAVFFFGGGWVSGNPNQFYPHCQHLADRGVVAISAEYRVKNRHQTTPFECVKDGKSAVRWIREHAKELRIDPSRIIAGGGSAGGHVAAATGTVPGLDEEDEDPNISARPNALVLFNPVYDNGPDGWGHAKVKDRFKEISPMHNITGDMPPAIVFLGTKDKLIPVKTAELFQKKMKTAGVQSELKLYKDRGHGFFNAKMKDGRDFRESVAQMDDFLKGLGYYE